MTEPAISDLELAALVSSRICHDIINPVAAIANGLEMLDEEQDASMRDAAFDLIRKSASQASAKLQFARLAFGAAGSAGAEIDLRDAEKVAREFVQTTGKHQLVWEGPAATLPKNKAKLLLNLVALGILALAPGRHDRSCDYRNAARGRVHGPGQGRGRAAERPGQGPAARRQRGRARCPLHPALLREPGGRGLRHDGIGRGARRRGRVQGRLTATNAVFGAIPAFWSTERKPEFHTTPLRGRGVRVAALGRLWARAKCGAWTSYWRIPDRDREGLDQLDVELVRFEQEPNDFETLNTIFRLVHTSKALAVLSDTGTQKRGWLGLTRP